MDLHVWAYPRPGYIFQVWSKSVQVSEPQGVKIWPFPLLSWWRKGDLLLLINFQIFAMRKWSFAWTKKLKKLLWHPNAAIIFYRCTGNLFSFLYRQHRWNWGPAMGSQPNVACSRNSEVVSICQCPPQKNFFFWGGGALPKNLGAKNITLRPLFSRLLHSTLHRPISGTIRTKRVTSTNQKTIVSIYNNVPYKVIYI